MYCIIKDCLSSKATQPGIAFFAFPNQSKDDRKAQCEAWKAIPQIMGLERGGYICELHFRSSMLDFIDHGHTKKLKPDAVPCLLLHKDIPPRGRQEAAEEQDLDQSSNIVSGTPIKIPRCVVRDRTDETRIVYWSGPQYWTIDTKYLWKEVNIELDEALNAAQKKMIRNVVSKLKKLIPQVKFFFYDEGDGKISQENYVRVVTSENGDCSSRVGMVGGRQDIHLAKGCFDPATITHEFLHCLGLMHEHQRHDRDEFIEVHGRNVSAEGKDDFKRLKQFQSTDYGIKYNPSSVMHYDSFAFARDQNKPTITLKETGGHIPEATAMQQSDKDKLVLIYSAIP